jgi:hypothetical protein
MSRTARLTFEGLFQVRVTPPSRGAAALDDSEKELPDGTGAEPMQVLGEPVEPRVPPKEGEFDRGAHGGARQAACSPRRSRRATSARIADGRVASFPSSLKIGQPSFGRR